MSSVFTTIPGRTIKVLKKEYSIPFHIQFVQGYVVDVVHSSESLRYRGDNTINSIIALPWITTKAYSSRNTAGEEYRYYPLLRGMTDIPSKGDPILLCTMGKINYYLGPLNTNKNNPTWNEDPSMVPEIITRPDRTGNLFESTITGESPNFNKENLYQRLGKFRKKDLDYGDAVYETTGDTLLEGRHGNSLRIGSRSNNPYVFISNNREPLEQFESFNDGSLISITSDGNLQKHFGDYQDGNLLATNAFKLSSDTIQTPSATIGDMWTDFNGNQDAQEIYNYSGNQILFQSDRITLNTKLDDIFISSKKDIHIGAGRHLTLSSNDTITFQTSQFNIGNPERAIEMQSMVLGDTLLAILEELVDTLGACTSNQYFPLPLASNGTPLKGLMAILNKN